jgi:hypothetical protein
VAETLRFCEGFEVGMRIKCMQILKIQKSSLRSFLALATFAVAAVIVMGANDSPAASRAPETFTVEFSGGSLAQLLAQLNNAQHWAVDIVGSKEDLDAATLPPFSVHNIQRGQFMGLLANILSRRGFEFDPSSPDVAVLNKREGNVARNFFSKDLSPFLDTKSVDDIVDAIRTACSMNPSPKGQELKIKFHPQTKLLLISGNDQDVNIAIRVLISLDIPQKEGQLNSKAKSAEIGK